MPDIRPDAKRLVDYISTTSPVYAEGVVLRIDQRLQAVRADPQMPYRARRVGLRQIPSIAVEARMDWREHIWIDPERMHGKPCMRGTRIPVHVVLDNLAIGGSEAAILAEYPSLTREHIRAALAFASDLAHDRILPVTA